MLNSSRNTSRVYLSRIIQEQNLVGVSGGIITCTGCLAQVYIGFGGLQVHVRLVENKKIHVKRRDLQILLGLYAYIYHTA